MSKEPQGTRLNKYLASCGVGSRRACDKIIQEGEVYINGSRCDNPATQVEQDDVVRVGKKMVAPKVVEVVLFNKPAGLVCSKSDELGRETIYHILPPHMHHLKNVGRLDKESEGLLVLTNDGDLALKLTHPSLKVEKEYLVTLNQAFDNEVIERLLKGVQTPEGRARAKAIKRISPRRVRVVLETGLKRQIRYMFDACHLKVIKLVRTRIGTLEGGGLELGNWRELEPDEIVSLQRNPKVRKVLETETKTLVHRKAGRPSKFAEKKQSSHRPNGKRFARKAAKKTTYKKRK
ncbi:MAG: pseudouridine synthase [Akkermansiaceae bacterium]